MSKPTLTSAQTDRVRYRTEVLPAHYSGPWHLPSVLLPGGSAITVALWLASASWRPADFLVIPARGQLPVVAWLAHLHRVHHTPPRMQQRNFNLVFPLCDWIIGTLHTDRRGTNSLPSRPHPGAHISNSD